MSPVICEQSKTMQASKKPQKVCQFNLIVEASINKIQNMFDDLPTLVAPRLADL
jgi:hypothetical protein